MPFIRTLANGDPQIIKDVAFCTLLNGQLPDDDFLISNLLDQMDAEIKVREPRVKSGALGNSHGDWYEWLLAISAWNTFVRNPAANLAMLLPNITRFDVARLYTDDLFELILDLRAKVLETSQVQLITSNPDFVIVNRDLANQVLGNVNPIIDVTPEALTFLQNLFTNFVGLCGFTQIYGYMSVKTSFRPDRRLQIPHEGSLTKAIYTHLQTRKWIINPPGLKYYAIATSVGAPDRDALKTVATHSITTVSSLPQAAVDDVFEINSLRRAYEVFERILTTV